MPLFECGNQFSLDYCHWSAMDLTEERLRTKIVEHARIVHKLHPIPYDVMANVVILSIVDWLKKNIENIEKRMEALSDTRIRGENGNLTQYGELKNKLFRWREYLETLSPMEIEWIVIEENKMKGSCPNALVFNGIRIDVPSSNSCEEDHCPQRFCCKTSKYHNGHTVWFSP